MRSKNMKSMKFKPIKGCPTPAACKREGKCLGKKHSK